MLGDQVRGWYSVDERSAGVHRGEDERKLAESEQALYDEAAAQAASDEPSDQKPADSAQHEDD